MTPKNNIQKSKNLTMNWEKLCSNLNFIFGNINDNLQKNRSSHPGVFLRNFVLKICSKFTEEHSCGSVISIKLQSNFTEIALRQGCSPVNLLHIFRAPFLSNTFGWLPLIKYGWSHLNINIKNEIFNFLEFYILLIKINLKK